ncbi:hypothetical protein BDV25DRAFT_160462, partial [Aspergillus avenaceus]
MHLHHQLAPNSTVQVSSACSEGFYNTRNNKFGAGGPKKSRLDCVKRASDKEIPCKVTCC